MKTYIFQVKRRRIEHGIAQFTVQANSREEAEQFFASGSKYEISEHIESTYIDDRSPEIIHESIDQPSLFDNSEEHY